MISSSAKHTVVVFGNGEVSVTQEDTPEYPSVQLAECSTTAIGKVPKKIKAKDLIELTFLNRESLQVLIDKLEDCKDWFDEQDQRRDRSQAV